MRAPVSSRTTILRPTDPILFGAVGGEESTGLICAHRYSSVGRRGTISCPSDLSAKHIGIVGGAPARHWTQSALHLAPGLAGWRAVCDDRPVEESARLGCVSRDGPSLIWIKNTSTFGRSHRLGRMADRSCANQSPEGSITRRVPPQVSRVPT
jgi:hypothetical protein